MHPERRSTARRGGRDQGATRPVSGSCSVLLMLQRGTEQTRVQEARRTVPRHRGQEDPSAQRRAARCDGEAAATAAMAAARAHFPAESAGGAQRPPGDRQPGEGDAYQLPLPSLLPPTPAYTPADRATGPWGYLSDSQS